MPITGAQVQGITDAPVVGAVAALAVDPFNPDYLFAATVNGGVWGTQNATVPPVTSVTPGWAPLTDQNLASLSMGAVALSPADANGLLLTKDTPFSQLVVYAGNARVSSAGRQGTATGGIYQSVNGGGTWTLTGQLNNEGASADFAGLNVVSIVPTALPDPSGSGKVGQVILAATSDVDATKINHRGGVYKSIDGGQTWTRISGNPALGLPDAGVSDLIEDPSNPSNFYAAVPGFPTTNPLGERAGIYQSTDGGDTFQPFDAGIPTTILNFFTTRIKLAIHYNGANAGSHVLWAGFITSAVTANGGAGGALSGLCRYDFTAPAPGWTSLALPSSQDGPPGNLQTNPLIPGLQGDLHFSIAADPFDPRSVYLGGDRQPLGPQPFQNEVGATQPAARIFRGQVDDSGTVISWTQIVGNDAQYPFGEPHADSRELVFDGNNLLEADDGGIYELPNPRTPGQWVSLIGTLRDTEFNSIAYDPALNTIIGGTQDVGTVEGPAVLDPRFPQPSGWSTPLGGDGVVVQVDASNANQPIHYFSTPNLDNFEEEVFQGGIKPPKPTPVALQVSGMPLSQVDKTLPGRTPWLLNAVDRSMMLIGSNTKLWEGRIDNTTTPATPFVNLNDVSPPGLTMTQIWGLAYGGTLGNSADATVAFVSFVATGNNYHFMYRQGTTWTEVPNFPVGRLPRAIALDPSNWHTVYALDFQGNIWMTQDVTASSVTWTNLTTERAGLRVSSNPADPPAPGSPAYFQTIELAKVPAQATTPAADVLLVGGIGVYRLINPADPKSVWTAYGDNLPNVLVTDLHFIPADPIDPTKGDVLLAGTAGRGAWLVPNASQTLGVAASLFIDDGGLPSTITVARSDTNPDLLNVQVMNSSGTQSDSVFLADLTNIVASASGNTNLIVDSSNGVIYVPGGFGFDGGAGGSSTLTFQSRSRDFLEPLTPSPYPGFAADLDVGRALGAPANFEEIGYANATVINNLGNPLNATMSLFGAGLEGMSDASRALDDPTLLGQPLPLIGTSLGQALNGMKFGNVQTEQDPADGTDGDTGDAAVTDAGTSILDRFVGTGAGAFSLADIGTTIASVNDLQSLLLALDPQASVTVGNVTNPMDPNDQAVLFDVDIHKVMFGLTSVSTLVADVTFHVQFGIDQYGFFWNLPVPANPSSPVLTIGNIGLPMLDSPDLPPSLQADVLSLKNTTVTVQLQQVAPDSANGLMDGWVRLDQLGALLPQAGSASVQIAAPVQQNTWSTQAGTTTNLTAGPKPTIFNVADAPNIQGSLALDGVPGLSTLSRISAFQEFTAAKGSGPAAITTGPDGALWFTEPGLNKIGRITTAGNVSDYVIPPEKTASIDPLTPTSVVTGPDGNLWFTESNVNHIEVMNPSGSVIQVYAAATPDGTDASGNPIVNTLGNLVVAPDKALWFTVSGSDGSSLKRIDTAGNITVFPLTLQSVPQYMALGPDGNLWFTESPIVVNGTLTNYVTRRTITSGATIISGLPRGTITEFPLALGRLRLADLTSGPGGDLWATAQALPVFTAPTPSGPQDEILHLQISQLGVGTLSLPLVAIPIPTVGSGATGIASGPDGNLWFTERYANQVGVLAPSGAIKEFPLPTSGAGPLGVTSGPDGNMWFTEAAVDQVGTALLPQQTAQWQITGPDSGQLNSNVAFTGILNLEGGLGADTFSFETDSKTKTHGSLVGSVSGGFGPATLDYIQLSEPVQVTLAGPGTSHGWRGTESHIGGFFDNIDAFLGNGIDVTIDDQATTDPTNWVITATSATRTDQVTGQTRTVQYSDSANLTVDAGSGGNTFIINSTPSGSTTINCGAGSDVAHVQGTNGALNISDAAAVDLGDLTHTVQGLLGAVSITNGASLTALSVDDTQDTAANPNVTIAATALTGLAPAPITYQSYQVSLRIAAGSGNNTFTIAGFAVPDGLSILGGSGQNTLVVDDHADTAPRLWTVASSTLTLGQPPFGLFPAPANQISYSHVSALTVSGGSGVNTFNISSTAAGTATTINASGASSVTLGDAFRILDNILGGVTVNGSRGWTDLVVDDGGNSAGSTYTITGSAVSFRANLPALTYHLINELRLFAGSGTNVINVNSTSVPTLVNAGMSGHDAISVGGPGNSLQGISGGLLSLQIAQSGNQVILNDQGNSDIQPQTYTFGSAGPNLGQVLPGTPGSAAILYQGPLQSLTLNATNSNDTFNVQSLPPAPTQLAIHGGSGANALQGPDTSNVWQIGGSNLGTLDETVSFSDVTTLLGGAGDDSFQFHNGGSLSGALDGGGGTNTLDLSQYTGNVAVNLRLHTATVYDHAFAKPLLVLAAVSNIENVMGSQGSDLLVGDAHANVLIGGTGRNILIGGNRRIIFAAPDQLTGSINQDNILIGGTTAYDGDVHRHALQRLMEEWLRTDLTFQARLSDISGGGEGIRRSALTGSGITLSRSTVSAGSTADVLTEPAGNSTGQYWFLAGPHDTIPFVKRGKYGDHVTRL
jgi:streptogramin lyase